MGTGGWFHTPLLLAISCSSHQVNGSEHRTLVIGPANNVLVLLALKSIVCIVLRLGAIILALIYPIRLSVLRFALKY